MKRQCSINESPMMSALSPSPISSSLQGNQDPVANFVCWFSNNGLFNSGLGVTIVSDGVTQVGGSLLEVILSSNFPSSWVVDWVGTSEGTGAYPLNININGDIKGFFTTPNGLVGIALKGASDVIYGTIAYHEVVFFDVRRPDLAVLKPAYFSEMIIGEEVGRFFRVTGMNVVLFWIGKTPNQLPSSNFKPTDYVLVQVPTQFDIPQP